jgi:hypothetical protein
MAKVDDRHFEPPSDERLVRGVVRVEGVGIDVVLDARLADAGADVQAFGALTQGTKRSTALLLTITGHVRFIGCSLPY